MSTGPEDRYPGTSQLLFVRCSPGFRHSWRPRAEVWKRLPRYILGYVFGKGPQLKDIVGLYVVLGAALFLVALCACSQLALHSGVGGTPAVPPCSGGSVPSALALPASFQKEFLDLRTSPTSLGGAEPTRRDLDLDKVSFCGWDLSGW